MYGSSKMYNFGTSDDCSMDTNYDPNLANILFPTNDDVIASIRLILNRLAFAICDNCFIYIYIYTQSDDVEKSILTNFKKKEVNLG